MNVAREGRQGTRTGPFGKDFLAVQAAREKLPSIPHMCSIADRGGAIRRVLPQTGLFLVCEPAQCRQPRLGSSAILPQPPHGDVHHRPLATLRGGDRIGPVDGALRINPNHSDARNNLTKLEAEQKTTPAMK